MLRWLVVMWCAIVALYCGALVLEGAEGLALLVEIGVAATAGAVGWRLAVGRRKEA